MNNAIAGGRVRWPHHLPNDRHALVTVTAGTLLLDLGTRDARYLFSGIQARYLPTGHLIFNAGQERIRVVPFDLDRLEIIGPEEPALENVFRGPASGAANFVVSQTGTLVYVAGGFERSLWFVDRTGRETPVDVPPRGYRFPRLSPDGSTLAVTVDPRPSDIWVIDLVRSSGTPVTSDLHNLEPAWSPDGTRLTFERDGDQHWIDWREPGEPQRVASRPLAQYSPSWSRDDLIVVFETTPETGADLITLHLEDGTATPFLVTPDDERFPRLSPDGRWVAYTSNLSGVDEVYVLPFPEPGARHLVSRAGGTDATWSTDGTELFYRIGNRILAVDVGTTPTFSSGEPRDLFSGPYDFTQTNNWDVGPDGRFVMIKGDPSTFQQFQVVLNWFEELEGGR